MTRTPRFVTDTSIHVLNEVLWYFREQFRIHPSRLGGKTQTGWQDPDIHPDWVARPRHPSRLGGKTQTSIQTGWQDPDIHPDWVARPRLGGKTQTSIWSPVYHVIAEVCTWKYIGGGGGQHLQQRVTTVPRL